MHLQEQTFREGVLNQEIRGEVEAEWSDQVEMEVEVEMEDQLGSLGAAAGGHCQRVELALVA